MSKQYFEDDRPRDLPKYEGLSNQDIKEAIEHVENIVMERKERCKNMTKEERLKEFERSGKNRYMAG